MAFIYHPDRTRRYTDMEFMELRQSFHYSLPPDLNRGGFGLMPVLDNGHFRAGGKGFGMHPHRDIEIVSVLVSGRLAHQDDRGNSGLSLQDAVQVVGAGTGIMHNEYNESATERLDMLQIWFRPREKGLPPVYHHGDFAEHDRQGQWQLLVSPNGFAGSLPIRQQVHIYRTSLQPGQSLPLPEADAGRQRYLFMLEGDASVDGHALHRRDGLGLINEPAHQLAAMTETDALLIIVPEQQA